MGESCRLLINSQMSITNKTGMCNLRILTIELEHCQIETSQELQMLSPSLFIQGTELVNWSIRCDPNFSANLDKSDLRLRKDLLGDLEILGGPQGARFGPNSPKLARLCWTHGHHTL